MFAKIEVGYKTDPAAAASSLCGAQQQFCTAAGKKQD
jgi:hypothetical protein